MSKKSGKPDDRQAFLVRQVASLQSRLADQDKAMGRALDNESKAMEYLASCAEFLHQRTMQVDAVKKSASDFYFMLGSVRQQFEVIRVGMLAVEAASAALDEPVDVPTVADADVDSQLRGIFGRRIEELGAQLVERDAVIAGLTADLAQARAARSAPPVWIQRAVHELLAISDPRVANLAASKLLKRCVGWVVDHDRAGVASPTEEVAVGAAPSADLAEEVD